MSNYISNPTKEVMCNFTIQQVKDAIKKLPTCTKLADLDLEIDVMGYFKFSCKGTKLFSLGMLLDITVQEVTDNKTLIKLECRRKIGAIDNGIELSECIEFMIGTISLLSKVLTNSI